MKRKISRKGAWMPSDRSIQRIAQELATEAADRMSLYILSNRLNIEYVVAYKNRRPYLDDRKIVFYGAVVDAVNTMIKKFERGHMAHEDEAEDEDAYMDYGDESNISSEYSGISSSDLPIPLCLVDTGKAVDDIPSSDPASPAATFGVPSPRPASVGVSSPRSASRGMSSPRSPSQGPTSPDASIIA
ncbi:hypothetical protein B0T18DRAFT_394181 [Schizothecium vesticola]|uniref:Uncharacterized protein n=1 Tax=Schizothecium vesticola TaxID=314040 RepID=A0AA40BPA8_9PEZI|nr:hypothetical protein B0T18DRAFT_394181 [Schizothecium vesticola]